MRTTTTLMAWGALLLLPVLPGCDRDGGNGDQQEETGSALTGPSPQNIYNAQLSPQERAQRNLRGLFDRSVGYFEEVRTASDGMDTTHFFPGSAPPTPAEVPCGEPVQPQDADFSHPTWRALRFEPTDPIFYSYQYDSAGTGEGATFQITAIGDLDCDGERSTFVRRGTGLREGRISGDTEARISGDTEVRTTSSDP